MRFLATIPILALAFLATADDAFARGAKGRASARANSRGGGSRAANVRVAADVRVFVPAAPVYIQQPVFVPSYGVGVRSRGFDRSFNRANVRGRVR